jgi:hypothetical protein
LIDSGCGAACCEYGEWIFKKQKETTAEKFYVPHCSKFLHPPPEPGKKD